MEQFTNALQRQAEADAEGPLPEAAEELADEMAAAALGFSHSLSRQVSGIRERLSAAGAEPQGMMCHIMVEVLSYAGRSLGGV